LGVPAQVGEVRTGGGLPRVPSPPASPRAGRRRFVDRLARGFVSLGGITIIAAILMILVVILLEVIPLFRKPAASLERRLSVPLGEVPLAVGMDEYRECLYAVTREGLRGFAAADGRPMEIPALASLRGAPVTAVSHRGRGSLALGLGDGRIVLAEVGFAASFEGSRRLLRAEVREIASLAAGPEGKPVRLLAHAASEKEILAAAAAAPDRLALFRLRKRKSLVGGERLEEMRVDLTLERGTDVTALAVDDRGENLFVGTSRGEVLRFDWNDPRNPRPAGATAAGPAGVPVTVLGFLLGDRTLIAGDGKGGVAGFQMLLQEKGWSRLVRVRDFAPHQAAVMDVSPSGRNKSFLTADASGALHLHYGTTGDLLLSLEGGGGACRAALSAKGDGVVAVGKGEFRTWSVGNPHPEVTARSLFGKVWYEGYPGPEFVWQSTGATDDFESKYSLIPLIFGTLKGTFYALAIAVPVALLSALYVSQFLHPGLKGVVKPVIEVMAALPSVVLGFVAGLWLAPRVERLVPGLFLSPLVLVTLIPLALMAWRCFPTSWRRLVRPGMEVALLVPVVVLGMAIAFGLGRLAEAALLEGDYRGWLHGALGLTYDQRNSLVVGLAMGFAVIPIIFTIAEDSLSNVPPHLAAASLALGATPWQTAVRVILPTASPGIFSAVMIGFGRAVGETMIVLMATGNTPIMDLSPFNGFRALSANIAVELPETSEGSTHFRVLFLAAFLLFLMTFVVNTAAEGIRLRLRKRYQGL